MWLEDSVAARPAVGTGGDLVSDHGAVPLSCFGVEFHPICRTPFGELVGVDVYAHDSDPRGPHRLAAILGCDKPLFIGPREFLAVLKDGAKAGIGIWPVPGHADDLDLHDGACDV